MADQAAVRASSSERQNLDFDGHCARPDITRLVVDRRRQNIASFDE